MKKFLVTGGNSGIGFALCQQLVEAGHRVFLGSRDKGRGDAAVKSIGSALCSVVIVDVTSDESVKAAAESLSGHELDAIVNNAGVGLMHPNTTPLHIIDVNLRGAKRVCEAFIPLLKQDGGRIVSTSSGAASSYICGEMMGKPMGIATATQKKPLIDFNTTWDQIEAVIQVEVNGGFTHDEGILQAGWCAYGLSKAGLTAYSMLLAKQHPNLLVSSCSPGFINTKMTAGWGAALEPKDGTRSLKHCLLNDLGGNGWYFGSDGVRSPLHYMRSPGEPAYDGSPGEPGDPAW